MKKLEFATAYGDYAGNLPCDWSELTTRQAVQWLAHVSADGLVLRPIDVAALVGIPAEVGVNLTPDQWQVIGREIEWLLQLDTVDRWLLPSLDRDYRPADKPGTLLPPDADFSNMDFEEWVWTDALAARRMWKELAVALYRPATPCGRRERFDRYVWQRRVERGTIDSQTAAAVGVNHLLLRARFVKRWPRLFAGEVKVDGGHDSQRPTAQEPAATDWMLMLRRLLGERFCDERRALRLPVAAVMERLNSVCEQ